MSSLSADGIKCDECVMAVTLNSAAQICSEESKNPGVCEALKEKAYEGELSVGDFLKKMEEQCETDTCKFQINELGEFFKEEYGEG